MKKSTLRMVYVGLMIALMMVLAFVPNIGFIPLGVASVSLVHLPVVVGAIVLGWKEGLILSLAFGLISWARSYMPAGAADVLFQNPLIAVLPRLMIGFCAFGCFKLFKTLFEYLAKKLVDKGKAFHHTAAYLAGALLGFGLAAAVYFALLNIAHMSATAATLIGCAVGVLLGIGVNNTVRDGLTDPNRSAALFGCAAGALGNTVFTLLAFYFFVPAFFKEVLVANDLVENSKFIAYLLGLAGTNGVLEMLVFAVIGTPVTVAVQRIYAQGGNKNASGT